MADLFFGGGLNETDPYHISPGECTQGCNFLIDARRQSFAPRPPQDLIGTATNGGAIRGIMQMIDGSDTDTMLIKADNVIYEWDGSSFTSKYTDTTTSSRFRSTHYGLDDAVTLNGLLIVTDLDKNDPVYRWDGTTFSRLPTALVAGAPATIAGVTRAGAVATATHTSHGWASNDLITIAGANETEYNGEHQITVTGANTFTYAVTGSPATPATGTVTADLGVVLKAKYSAIKDGRVWLFNIKTDSDELDHVILASKFENAENYDTSNRGKAQDASSAVTGTDPFFLYSPDLKQINGVVEFFNQLVISTVDGGLYKLTGTTPETYNFVDYYKGSSASGTETMINTGNDVMYIRNGGDIERVSDTDRSGDLAADDASLFIPITKLLLSDAQAVYDQAHQRVLWFAPDFILVYDKTSHAVNPEVSPWMKWVTAMPNTFTTQAATYVRRPNEDALWTVYWGDSDGRIYDLNGRLYAGDAGSYSIATTRTTKFISEFQTRSDLTNGRIQYRRTGSCDLVMSFEWGDEYNTTENVVPLKGPIITGDPPLWGGEFYWNGTDYWNEGTVSGSPQDNLVSTVGFSAVGKSIGFFLTTTVTSVAKFLVDKITFDEPIKRR